VSEGNSNKKLAFSGHRPEGMKEYAIGSQGSQRKAVLEQKM